MQSINATLFASLLVFALPAFADSEKPAPIDNITIDAQGSSGITISWDQPYDNVGVDGYNVYRNGGYYTTIYGRTSYTDSNVNSGNDYEYYVVAFDAVRNYATKGVRVSATAGESGDASGSTTTTTNNNSSNNSSDSTSTLASGKPAAPSNLTAQVDSSSTATLSWSTPAGGAEGFNVYKDGSYYTTVKGSNDYTATNLSSGRNYEFQVVAFRNNEFSTKSPGVFVETSGDSDQSVNVSNPPPPNNDDDDSGSNSDNSSSAVPANYELVFSEEFNNSSMNSSKWTTSYRWGADWIINNEEQYYVDTQRTPGFGVNPFKTNGSTLTIQASRTPDSLRNNAQGQRYLSGAMTTYNKFGMTYGYVEMRAKMPRGKGLWPAFWLLHQTENGIRPEIDVVEMLGDNTNRVYQTYHYFDNFNLRSTPSYQASGSDFASDFHTYGMLWERGRITWYVDGVQTNSYESGNVSSERMYILLNLALGGSWAGSPDGSTSFPANFEIDYVRAYQQR